MSRALRAGVFVYVPKGVEIEHPIEIYHWLSGENASVFPHTLIVTGDNARVSVIDYFASEREQSGFACSVADLVAGRGSKLKHVCCQNWAEKARSIHINSTTVGADADVKSLDPQLRNRVEPLGERQPPGWQRSQQRHAVGLPPRGDPRRWTSAPCNSTSSRTPPATCSTRTPSTTSRARSSPA